MNKWRTWRSEFFWAMLLWTSNVASTIYPSIAGQTFIWAKDGKWWEEGKLANSCTGGLCVGLLWTFHMFKTCGFLWDLGQLNRLSMAFLHWLWAKCQAAFPDAERGALQLPVTYKRLGRTGGSPPQGSTGMDGTSWLESLEVMSTMLVNDSECNQSIPCCPIVLLGPAIASWWEGSSPLPHKGRYMVCLRTGMKQWVEPSKPLKEAQCLRKPFEIAHKGVSWSSFGS